MKILNLLLCLVVPFLVEATELRAELRSTQPVVPRTTVKTTPQSATLKKVLEKYSKASSLQFDIKKTDEKVILGTKSVSQGLLKLQKNKIYILQNGDKKVEVFYLNKTLTLVEHPDADFGPDGKRKISVFKNAKSPLIKSLLSLFSDPANFKKQFSVTSEKLDDGTLTIEFSTKIENLKNLLIKVNVKDLELLELSFTDDVETRTTLQFENQKLNGKMSKSDFLYKPLKTDEVMIE